MPCRANYPVVYPTSSYIRNTLSAENGIPLTQTTPYGFHKSPDNHMALKLLLPMGKS